MICAHLLAHIFIKFEQCNKKIEKCVLSVQQRYTQTIYDKKIKKNKNKKREKVGDKRGGRKIKERKRNLSQGKKSPSSNKLL